MSAERGGGRGRDARLVVPAAAAWAAALVTTMLPEAAPWGALGCWAAALLLTLWSLRRHAPSGVVVLAVVAIAVAAAVASHVALTRGARAQAASVAIDGGRAIEVAGIVASKVEPTAAGELRFDVDATLLTTGADATGVAVPVSVQVAPHEVDHPESLDLGSAIVARGTAMRTDAGERAVLVVFASRGVTVGAGPPGILGATAGLRDGFVAIASGLPGPGGGLLPGLAVGDTSAVGAELDAAMKASSLSHLTAVSGANCALVVGLVFAAAGALRLRRGVRIAASLTALGGFVLLVTPEPSVVRAAAMATIAMLALVLDRPGAGLAVLSLAVAVLLVGDPWLAGSLGFALSAAATGALLVLARPLAEGLARWMPRPLALALAVPLSAQLVCGPLIVLIDPRVPLYGVVANLIAGPAAPIATVVGLAACLSAPVVPLATVLAWVAWLPAAWIAGTARTFAAIPGGQIAWLEGWWGALALAAVGAAVVLLVRGRGRSRVSAVLHRTAAGALAILLGAGAGFGMLGGALAPLTIPAEWSIAQCDIGQGDALIVRSEGVVALVDTGPDPALLEACLTRTGIRSIDLLVLTHFDLDHVGGVAAVVGRADTVLHGPISGAEDEDLLRLLSRAGARLIEGRAGLAGSLGGARWRVLWPRADSRAFEPGNDGSIVLDVRAEDDPSMPRGLYLGDLGAAAQRSLAASGALAPPYDLVKVAHHGSADQDPALYEGLGATLALIGVGADNDYGHPRDEILGVLDASGAVIVRSDLDGLSTVRGTAAGLDVWREHPTTRARGPPARGHGRGRCRQGAEITGPPERCRTPRLG